MKKDKLYFDSWNNLGDKIVWIDVVSIVSGSNIWNARDIQANSIELPGAIKFLSEKASNKDKIPEGSNITDSFKKPNNNSKFMYFRKL